ncbi:WbqC family protein [uncultured Roseovarius sp.]|uniref:WbqC family protein n=1 Tax=uncultured Roseovarius sp. TaxID=293344 RepID=UPI0026149B67|nr:WbqC family protein [uncultured Roseovarius sp.]
MQPYFLPYIGYWQMMQAVDEFVIYDDVQFTRGWINRNRMLWNGDADMFTLPLRKGSNRANIDERYLTDAWENANRSLTERFSHAYSRAPHFSRVMALVDDIFGSGHTNLADFLCFSLEKTRDYLGIETRLSRSSQIEHQEGLRAAQRIQAIARARGADIYVNAPGGRELYDIDDFKSRGIELKFIQTGDITYPQFENTFVPSLSILDVMMFNDPEEIRDLLGRYTLD